ncbi:hypothetical protein Hanom_Chr02g00112521 [Helianthus anomalus]
MEKEHEEAITNGRYDKKRECYVNRDGEPVVHKKKIVYEYVLAVIPLLGNFYSNLAKDMNYEKKLQKLVKDVMTNVAGESKVEAVKEEDVMIEEEEKIEEKVVEKKFVSEEWQTKEEMKKKE